MKAFMIAVLATVTLLVSDQPVEQPTLYEMHATAYILTGTTATGTETREGICATGRREWLGKTAILYQRMPDGSIGNIIGIYDIEDTGCKKNVIDVWTDGMQEAQKFMDKVYKDNCKGKIYVQIVEADG